MYNFIFGVLGDQSESCFLSSSLSVFSDPLVNASVNWFFNQKFTANVALGRSNLGDMILMGFGLFNYILFVLSSALVLKSSYVWNVWDYGRKGVCRVSLSNWQVIFSIHKHSTFLHDSVWPLGTRFFNVPEEVFLKSALNSSHCFSLFLGVELAITIFVKML